MYSLDTIWEPKKLLSAYSQRQDVLKLLVPIVYLQCLYKYIPITFGYTAMLFTALKDDVYKIE